MVVPIPLLNTDTSGATISSAEPPPTASQLFASATTKSRLKPVVSVPGLVKVMSNPPFRDIVPPATVGATLFTVKVTFVPCAPPLASCPC